MRTIHCPMARRKPIRHRIEYTKNKHSRAICRGDTIVIRLAKNLSKSEEQEHIRSLLRRMTQLVLEEQEKTLISPFTHLLQGGQTQTVKLSTNARIHIALQAGKKTSVKQTARGWTLTVGPALRRKALHRALWNIIAETQRQRITALVHTINQQTFRVSVREVRLQFATTQWGSCSPSGVIMLNTALLFVPPSILRYVIVHELAHRLHADHSPAFWRAVERGMPTYKRAYMLLKQYRLPQE